MAHWHGRRQTGQYWYKAHIRKALGCNAWDIKVTAQRSVNWLHCKHSIMHMHARTHILKSDTYWDMPHCDKALLSRIFLKASAWTRWKPLLNNITTVCLVSISHCLEVLPGWCHIYTNQSSQQNNWYDLSTELLIIIIIYWPSTDCFSVTDLENLEFSSHAVVISFRHKHVQILHFGLWFYMKWIASYRPGFFKQLYRTFPTKYLPVTM